MRLEINTSSRLMTCSKRLQDVLQKFLQYIFKMFSRILQYVFKTSSKRMYHQVKLFLLTRLQDVFKTFSRHI